MLFPQRLRSLFHATIAISGLRTIICAEGLSSRRDVILGSSGAGLLLSSTRSSDPIRRSATTANMSVSSEETTTIHWGIVGLGDVTQVKSGPPFWKCHGSELAAVMRRTPGKASEFARRVPTENGQTKCVGYDNLESFLKHPGLDAVYVATRPGTHSEIAKKVAEAGLACYVEKPVGRCASETRELTEIFHQKGLPLYTAYISRAYERTQAVRKLMGDGAIGDKLTKVTYILRGTGGARDMSTKDLPWRLDASQSGGGLIMDVGCHVLDRIDYLCGPMEEVRGSAEQRLSKQSNNSDNGGSINAAESPVENYCSVTAIVGPSMSSSMPNGGCEGAIVDLTWDFSIVDDEDAKDELRFIGSNGRSLKMTGMSPNGPVELLDQDGTTVLETLTFDMPEHTAQRLIQAVTNDLIVRKKEISIDPLQRSDVLSFGENAVRTQQVIDTMLEGYYGGREIGYWSRMESWPGRCTGSSEKNS